MKNYLTQTAILALLLAAPHAHAALAVFACEPEWAALANEIGGDQVKAESAITAFQDPHYIQARPSLIARVRRADLVICSGADLEIGWLPLLLRQASNPRVQVGAKGLMTASDYVDLLDKPDVVDRAQGDIHPSGNPHIQTDPRNIAKVATALADRLASLDPDHAAAYAANYKDFSQRWNAAIQHWTAEAQPIRGTAIVIHHKSWVYMCNWLGLREAGALEPKPGVPPSASHLADLLQQLKGQSDVRMIVRSAYQNSRGSEWLSDRTHIPAVVIPQTVGAADGTDDLFGLFDVMIERLLHPDQ
jgi:zinc/manganese transport system substrate-binding protein